MFVSNQRANCLVRPGTSDNIAELNTMVLEMTQHISANVFHSILKL